MLRQSTENTRTRIPNVGGLGLFAGLLLTGAVFGFSACTIDFSVKDDMSTSTNAPGDADTLPSTDAADPDPDSGDEGATDVEADSGSETDDATDTDPGSDIDTDTGVCVDTDAGADTDTVPEVTQCDRNFGDFVGNEKKAIGDMGTCNNHACAVVDVWETTPNSNQNVWSYLEIEMWAPRLGTADLSISGDIFNLDNYVIFAAGCIEIANREVCNKRFLATQGTLSVTDVDPDEPWSGKLTFTITDAKLVEMKANWKAETFSWVKNGETVCVDSWSYDGSVSKGDI